MRLRLPSFAFSWAKTAAKPAVSRSATGTRASELPVPGRRQGSPAVFSISSSSETASPRERRSWPVTASLRRGRQRLGLDRAGVALAVELDPEGQFVGGAAVEGDAAGVVGAEEPDLAVAVPGAEGDRGDHEQTTASDLQRPCAGRAALGRASSSSRRLRAASAAARRRTSVAVRPASSALGADQRRPFVRPPAVAAAGARRPRAGRRRR